MNNIEFEHGIAESLVSSELDPCYTDTYTISSAAYIQSDDGEAPDHIIFSVDHSATNVFCLFTGIYADDDRTDPDLWRFLMLDVVPDTDFITLPVLLALEPSVCTISTLQETFKAVTES